ncbi:MAG: hypothetical protein K0Q76_2977 [Panacagrimonas sp.]|jgi:hypothetical protein|nr:DUF2505 domain-containing protein [Panacagrimonas sp.]MCC2657869.1 hypothetical protein [Panacagrimonas sp.]
MKFEERHSFDQPAETVMRMYADKAFFDRKYKEIGAIECELLDHQKTDARFSVKYRLVMKSDAPLPEVAKKIMGDTVKMVQQDAWDLGKRTGRIDIDIKGAPLKISADMKLIDEGGKGVNVQSWNVSCSIPLVGGKIEAAIAEDIKAKSRRDLAVSRKIILDY